MVIGFLLFFASPVVARERFLLSTGMSSHSGTSLSSLTGGQPYDLQAGEGLFLSLGVLFTVVPAVPHRFEAQLSGGYMFADRGGSDERVSWSHVPLEAVYFYNNTQELFRFGWGPIYHVGNSLSGRGINASASTAVENALGWTVTAEKFLRSANGNDLWLFGVKYNVIKYRAALFRQDADGSAVFLTLTGFFGGGTSDANTDGDADAGND